MIVTAGSTNRSVYFYIVGDAGHATPGEPIIGLLFSDIETGGSASYARQGAARTDLTLVTLASASAPHTDGGFILVDDTEMPGVYRCDYADATFVTGADEVILYLRVAGGKDALVAPLKVQILNVDLRDAVRGGMTALPNAVADGVGGLPISDGGGLDLDAILVNTAVIGAAGAGLTDLGGMSASMKTEINLEMVDVMDTDLTTLPGQEAPPATPTIRSMLAWIYKVIRNRKTQTVDTWSLYDDAGTIVDTKATVADDNTTASKTKLEAGP